MPSTHTMGVRSVLGERCARRRSLYGHRSGRFPFDTMTAGRGARADDFIALDQRGVVRRHERLTREVSFWMSLDNEHAAYTSVPWDGQSQTRDCGGLGSGTTCVPPRWTEARLRLAANVSGRCLTLTST
jgi:hypothetical protein